MSQAMAIIMLRHLTPRCVAQQHMMDVGRRLLSEGESRGTTCPSGFGLRQRQVWQACRRGGVCKTTPTPLPPSAAMPGAELKFGYHPPPFYSMVHLHLHCFALPFTPVGPDTPTPQPARPDPSTLDHIPLILHA